MEIQNKKTNTQRFSPPVHDKIPTVLCHVLAMLYSTTYLDSPNMFFISQGFLGAVFWFGEEAREEGGGKGYW